ncbi:AGAP005970-PA, partial [Anopheles gambiae str. PEST]
MQSDRETGWQDLFSSPYRGRGRLISNILSFTFNRYYQRNDPLHNLPRTLLKEISDEGTLKLIHLTIAHFAVFRFTTFRHRPKYHVKPHRWEYTYRAWIFDFSDWFWLVDRYKDRTIPD